MMYVHLLALLLVCPLALSRHDDDFAFDNGEEFQVDLTANHSDITKNGLQRLWGVPDTAAYVGHLFRMEIPKEAFTGQVLGYKVRSADGRRTPSWLAVDSRHGLVSGVPLPTDIGAHDFSVIAYGRTDGLTATDSFTIDVKRAEFKPESKYGHCAPHENKLTLVILIDMPFHEITPKQRTRALMDLANFMALDWDEFWVSPYKPGSDAGTVLMGGGDASRRRGSGTTGIYLNVGCGDKMWARHRVLVAGAREQARDGSLAHVLRLPVLGWRVHAPAARHRRQIDIEEGSANYIEGADDDEYSGDDEDDADYYDESETHVDSKKVKIEPFDELPIEEDEENYTIPEVPRYINQHVGHSPVIIQPETEPPTTEAETELMTSSERTSTIIGRTTETVTFPMPLNQPPTLRHHMKKLATTAGKAFRYIIPADLFMDHEDGTNLTFSMYDNDNSPLGKDSWIQFMPEDREVYGLPLETHVSKWHYIVEARDSEGATARGPLDITVQEHKSKRTFNHEFVMTFKLMTDFKYAIDWQIRALEGIVNLFRDTDMDHLTVLNVTTVGDTHEFVWTNDTLPKENCPIEDIKRLMKILESQTSPGHPSAQTSHAMASSLSVSRVLWRGPCAAPPPAPRDAYPPVPRNQVDLLRATPGHLLRYRVPEDTFFDPEDGSTRNLNLSLRKSNRSPLSPDHWLQFDTKNQEFYGLPDTTDEGQTLYQLVAEDSSKKTAYDSLVVEVVKAPAIKPTVEFQMTMDYPYEMLADSAAAKRKVVEKLAALFGQTSTEDIRVQSITEDPTTIVWYNTSLPMDRCPKAEIEELRRMIITDEKVSSRGALKDNVDIIFNKDMKVMSIRLVPLGLCAEQHTKTRVMSVPGSADKSHNTKTAASDGYTEYLVTFVIPAVVIVCMILVAGVIACVLYRRRKTAPKFSGKMSVGDEEERQAFRSKGIPVIFQDELEERGDSEPVHKSPVIMREEKPPLLPPAPDYRTVDDAPYRPPPPFAPSHTPPRPKATPTYRKPPPYVPP